MLKEHCCCRSPAVAGDLANVVPAVSDILSVVAAAGVAGIIAVDDMRAVEYIK
jgi:hypothetical protein